MQSRAIHRDEAIARHVWSRTTATPDADLEKSVAGNVERVAGALNRDRRVTPFATHQRAEVVMPHRAHARPRCRTRRSAIYMSASTVIMRVDAARVYLADRVGRMSADGASRMR